MNLGTTIATAVVGRVLKEVLSRNDVPVDNRHVEQVATIAASELGPMLAHQNNSEPWYQSRVTLGSLLSIGVGIAGLFGIVIDADTSQQILVTVTALGTVIGGAVALWGRWVAKKPLGQ